MVCPFFDLFFFVCVFVLVLSCISCLFILETNYLSVISFAINFSHSEGYLLTLLIVSCKTLSLIRSHLLISLFICITVEGGS